MATTDQKNLELVSLKYEGCYEEELKAGSLRPILTETEPKVIYILEVKEIVESGMVVQLAIYTPDNEEHIATLEFEHVIPIEIIKDNVVIKLRDLFRHDDGYERMTKIALTNAMNESVFLDVDLEKDELGGKDEIVFTLSFKPPPFETTARCAEEDPKGYFKYLKDYFKILDEEC